MQAIATANPGQRFFTNHETRLFVALGARRAAQPETAVRTTAPAGKPLFPSSPLFTIVHYCSPLFRKKYCPAPVPRRQFFLERTKTRLWFSRNTNHETRNTAFFRITALILCPLLPTIARYCPALLGGKYCPAPVSSRRPVAAFQRVVERQGRLWRGMGGLRPPHRQHGLLGFHESRGTNYATWFFPVPPATPRRATPSPTNRFFTNHETRITAFLLFSLLSFALWSGVGGYGAAWAASASPGTGNTAGKVFTNHETRLFVALGARRAAQPETAVRTTAPAGKPLFPSSPLFTIVHYCSPLFRKKYCPAPVPRRQFFLERTKTRLWFSRNTNHETRNTAFFRITALILCPPLPVIARHCSGENIVLRQCPRAARLLLSSALWSGKGGYGAAWAGSVPRTGNTAGKVFTNHGFYAFHESRITQHGFSLSLRLLQGEQPQAQPTGFSRITRHETRNTAFLLPYSPFPTISHNFPVFPGIIRPPHTPNRSRVRPPSTVLGKPQDERRSPPLPPPSGLLPAAAKDR